MTNLKFELSSTGIKNGYILEKYGKYGTDKIEDVPSLSIPLQWTNPPEGTKQFALVMQDFDAIPVCGFSWIHWVALIPVNYTELPENASQVDVNLIQGVNSSISPFRKLDKKAASHFGGPAPPDKDHTYTFTIFALDKEIKLENGFYLNYLYKDMKNHILGIAELEGIYKC
ncbi:YbhB/YbcL family Raf kinase inhibitor-like protein [Cetobacterium sp. 2A]|uniref:YbhB/YbcL family Raf kinase inhibitor-like protein n=1 Tax=unclassified Cetobacterium TaxID=2630983 RepID=UPI00163B9C6F|nr:YbhB/YbcL family Raf kinase inhibitor-like protein [Cetobacterium sp. 2A]MBC2857205.1 YbhB/YbcL family Raf kinase inhibitor-like protein [Cetobacterium sp. 2A]